MLKEAFQEVKGNVNFNNNDHNYERAWSLEGLVKSPTWVTAWQMNGKYECGQDGHAASWKSNLCCIQNRKAYQVCLIFACNESHWKFWTNKCYVQCPCLWTVPSWNMKPRFLKRNQGAGERVGAATKKERKEEVNNESQSSAKLSEWKKNKTYKCHL